MILGAFFMAFLVVPCQARAQEPGTGLSIADVSKMLTAGIGEDLVIAKIVKNGRAFDLSTDDLIALKKAGASNAVLRALMNPAPAPAAAPAVVVTTKPSEYPDEIGVYVRLRGEWVAIDPEIVNMRTANVLGHAMSYGISKAKMKGDVRGNKSRLQIASPVELLIKAAEGVAATEYQILTLETKGDRREFEAFQMGFASAKSGARKGLIEPKFEKVGKAMYRTTLEGVKRGEYGILPPGAVTSASTASSGKMYSFGLIE
jgi:hypothetical protein